MSTASETSNQPLTTADGTPLRQSLRRSERLQKARAFGLVAPLFLFVLVFFVFPILKLVTVSIDNSVVPEILPNTVVAIEEWDGKDLPPEPVFAAMVADLIEGKKNRNIATVGKRLNFEYSGFRRLIIKSARRAEKLEAPYKEALIKSNEDWADPKVWQIIKRESGSVTWSYLLAALDMTYDAEGEISRVDGDQAIYVDIFARTLFISAQVTIACLLLGFPIAYLLSTLPSKTGNILMIFVLLPFWISLLVRTTAWIVLLQDQGVINSGLMFIGVIDEPLELIRNRVGVVIAMTHILLPFMILPLFSVMKGINPSLMRAASSMGANPLLAFWRVYVPLTVPGIGAGGLLVFIISIGYYITPALVGGP
ncbi:MAG: ABC transporter permease, partial [Alphaproteobacteria bacterium]|nr:ABC transporter permease [Alphaproteobacteria bacterium]